MYSRIGMTELGAVAYMATTLKRSHAFCGISI